MCPASCSAWRRTISLQCLFAAPTFWSFKQIPEGMITFFTHCLDTWPWKCVCTIQAEPVTCWIRYILFLEYFWNNLTAFSPRATCVCVYSVAQSCPTLCKPMDYNPPGSASHGISQARILEWVDISFPGDLSNPGIKPASRISCIGMRILCRAPPGNSL